MTKLIQIQISFALSVLFLFSHSFAQGDAMFINSAGNVGIGTNSPTNKLSVDGSANFTGNVGIGVTSPATQLEVKGSPNNTSIADGIIAPRISRRDLTSKSSTYKSDQKGAIIYVTDLTGTTDPVTANIGAVGYYCFDGSTWRSMNSTTNYGDIKMGIQKESHNGWVKLDGRSVSFLTTTQQKRAKDLGFDGSLPDASGKVMVQESTNQNMGKVIPATPVTQNQLPNVSLKYSRITSMYYGKEAAEPYSIYVPEEGYSGQLTAAWNGNAHNSVYSGRVETSSLNGGVTQQPLSTYNLPQLSVNMFIYLGE